MPPSISAPLPRRSVELRGGRQPHLRVRIARLINGITRQTPVNITVDDPCRDRMTLSNLSTTAAS
jgi:hypothetical protein